ncbi:MAG TPA: hypothetical protein VMB03_09540 [Bryobacteraceae bacterium]|nr:hypothetical protein [Bryobacteraceae bacterium]
MVCAICHTRRPRRFCPGVRGDICTICCGTGREVSVDCPLACEYLREAHRHEKPLPLDPETLPNRDIELPREKLAEQEEPLAFLAERLAAAATANPAIVDSDIREALDACVRTHRTLQSGLVYESLPANPLAAEMYRALEDAISKYRSQEAEQLGVHKIRDSTILGLLVFLQHFAISYNNGRPRGRAFLDALLDYYSLEIDSGGGSSLILP